MARSTIPLTEIPSAGTRVSSTTSVRGADGAPANRSPSKNLKNLDAATPTSRRRVNEHKEISARASTEARAFHIDREQRRPP